MKTPKLYNRKWYRNHEMIHPCCFSQTYTKNPFVANKNITDLLEVNPSMQQNTPGQESVVPNADASVDPVDDSNESPDDEDPLVVNPAITVIQSPAINIQQSESQTGPVMTGGKTTNSPGVTQSAGVGEMNEMNGRMKILEGQVKGLMEALEAENWFNWLVWLVVDS